MPSSVSASTNVPALEKMRNIMGLVLRIPVKSVQNAHMPEQQPADAEVGPTADEPAWCPPGRDDALAYRHLHFEAKTLSQLPVADGEVVWELAAKLMMRELPMVIFALVYACGFTEDEARAAGQQILNEWHGLPPDATLQG